MMISPECYYEEKLKGKNAEDVMLAIKDLKASINKLKNAMEHPEKRWMVMASRPSADTKIRYIRMYLEKAKQALAEAGGSYTHSPEELKAAAFEERIPAICQLKLSFYGGCYPNYESYTLDDTQTYFYGKQFDSQKGYHETETKFQAPKEAFLNGLRELHIGEWNSKYDTSKYGLVVLDGVIWTLEIFFSDKAEPLTIEGDNSYPYNFDKFLKLLGLNPRGYLG